MLLLNKTRFDDIHSKIVRRKILYKRTLYLNIQNFRLINPLLRVARTPIIILGNQKSGTTAITALLAKASKKSRTLDIPSFWGQNINVLLSKGKTFDEIIEENKLLFGNKIIKEPALTFHYDELIRAFPEGQFVQVIRHPVTNIKSQFARLGITDKFDEENFSELPENWLAFFAHSRLLAKEYTNSEQLSPVELAAYRWKKAANVFLENKDKIHLILYEDFLKNKEQTIYDLAERLNLNTKRKISDLVDVQYQPKDRTKKSIKSFFGMQNLERINRICSDEMIKLGYSPELE